MPDAAAQRLTIGEVARRTGLSVSAIRYYEAEGLVTPGRNAGGQRRFRRGDIRRLSFILIAQGLGLTLLEIADALRALPEGRDPTAADWAEMASVMRQDLDRRIGQLTRLRNRLDGCIGCGCLSLEACALYNPADRVATRGAGPRLVLDPDMPRDGA